MTLIEKAIAANKTAGSVERITVDGIEFSRLPLNEPVLCVPYDRFGTIRTLAEVTEIAKKAHEMIDSTGLTWEEYRNLPLFGPQYRPEVSIWNHFCSSLELLSNNLLHECNGISGIWYYNYDDDFLVIMPKDATHILTARYYPTPDDYNFLKFGCNYKFKSWLSYPNTRCAYFLDVENYDANTKEGIITI